MADKRRVVGGEDGLKGYVINQGQKVPADIEAPRSRQQAKPPVSCVNDGQTSRPWDIWRIQAHLSLDAEQWEETWGHCCTCPTL